MSKTIDQKVVEMRFDNSQFESNVRHTMSTLDKLKQSLNLKGASKGLENINTAANKCDMSGMSKGVEAVQAKFSALQVMAVTALANITNSAINAGTRIVKALTIDPIITGFQEYETQINAIQTIMANTSSKGTTLDQVNAALDELNYYADKTIYNFTEMTRNIGTFTAAGVDLETSVSSIQGIANLAAVSGSTSQQASVAMYQLSQAIATGTVKLIDWNSVVNAGMGGEVFQNALKKTARAHGIAVDEIIEKQGSFRESLSEGWLTAEILTETLSKFTKTGVAEYLSELTGVEQSQIEAAQKLADETGDSSKAYDELAQTMADTGKISKEEAMELLKMADTAEDAATKVKTFSQLWDTLKEAVQSGWAQTWRIVIGDFEEAKELLTEISDVLSGFINNSANARNEMLQGWKDLGGRTVLIDAFRNAFEGIVSVIKPIGQAFKEIFPSVTAKQLYSFTKGLKSLTENLKLSDETADNLKRTFKGVFAILDTVGRVVIAVFAPIAKALLGVAGAIGKVLLAITAPFGDFFTKIDEGVKAGDAFSAVGNAIAGVLDGISEALSFVASGFSNFGKGLSKIGQTIGNVFGKIGEVVGSVFSWIRENISAGDIFAGLAGGGIFVFFKKLTGFISQLKDMSEGGIIGMIFGKKSDDGPGIKEQFSDILGSVHDSLESFQQGIKVASLVGIAAAIALLTSSLKKISGIKPAKVAYSLVAIRLMIMSLNSGFESLTKTLSKFKARGTIKASIAMIGMATAINILASAMKKIAELDVKGVAKGLVAIGVLLAELSGAIKLIDKSNVSLKTSVAIIALAKACEMLADALQKFGGMSWGEIARGLTAMGGALTELTAVMAVMKKVGGGKSLLGSVSLLIAVQSLDEISENLERLGKLSWKEIGKGLTAMGGALGELTAVIAIMNKVGGGKSLLGSVSLVMAVQALDEISENLKRLGKLSWKEIGKGLTAMGGALTELGVVSGVLGKLSGFSGLLGAGAILLAAQSLGDIADALKKFGEMSWEEIARGLVGMGGALTEISLMSGALGMIAGFSGLIGAGTILLVSKGLGDIADALQKLGEMSWEEIRRGLAAMGYALGEIALGSIASTLGIIGGMTISDVSSSLGLLADAFIKFGSMDWDSVKSASAAMGVALGETALGGLLNTFSGFGADAIAKMAEPLGTLADSVKKWAGVTVPEGLNDQLGDLADGVQSFTLSGFGADSISTVAEPLGIMADSVKKWAGVTVPENIGSQLTSLAKGVMSFTFAGFGADSISAVVKPLGNLAGAISKWSGVTIPEGMEGNLKSLANGVKAWTWAFVGGWSIDAVVGPLGDLAKAIKKWNGVEIPEGIQNNLKGLANGVKAWTWAFVGGWSIDAVVGPLGNLAKAIKKWNGVEIPEGIQDKLSGFAEGLQSFEDVDFDNLSSESIGTAIGNLTKLKNFIANIGEINTENVANFKKALNELATVDVNNFANSFQNSTPAATSAVGNMFSGMIGAARIGSGQLSSTFGSAADNSASAVSGRSPLFSSAGSGLISAVANAIHVGAGAVSGNAGTAASNAQGAVNKYTPAFRSAGSTMVSNLANAIRGGSGAVSSNAGSAARGAKTAASSYEGGFFSIGSNMMSGLVRGIQSLAGRVASTARSIAKSAADTVRKYLDINSPSKVFRKIGSSIPEGFAMGISMFGDKVSGSAETMATQALDTTTSSMSQLSGLLSTGINTKPKISPVIDMSSIDSGNIQLGANINALLSQPVDSMSQIIGNAQAEINASNMKVIEAVNGLRDDLSALFADDGSEVALYVDSKKLASSIAKPMNRQLNILSRRGV